MMLERIVVAAEESEASRQGIRTALAWAGSLGASVTVYHVLPRAPAPVPAFPGARSEGESPLAADAADALEAWVAAEMADRPAQSMPAMATGYGLPGIEIPRFAERAGAGLLVLGRKSRSPAQRLFEGDTADAVARRSTVPCLFVRRPLAVPARILVAIDGTERGMRVLRCALEIATRLHSRLSGVIVERAHPGEPAGLADSVRTARTAQLQHRLDGAVEPLVVQRGDPATQILLTAGETRAELIVIGYRRGGPPGVVEAGSVARCVVHRTPCAVLTVPL